MNWVRKGLVSFLAFILFVSLLWGVAAYSVQTKLSKPSGVEAWLDSSGVYNRVIPAALAQAQDDSDKNGTAISVSYKDSRIQEAAKSAFTIEIIRNSAHQFIEGNYDWLSGKSPKPSFSVDLTQPKETFANNVGEYIRQRLAALPVCTAQQLSQLQIPIDPSTASCRPASLDPKTEGSRIASEIASNGKFLNKPIVTADTLNKDGSSKPYYERLSKLPRLYQVGQHLALIMAAIIVVCSLGIVFVHPNRRKGYRRVATTFVTAGALLVLTKFISSIFTDKLENAALNSSAKDQLNGSLTNFLHTAQSQLTQLNLIFGCVFILTGLTIYAYLFISREGREKRTAAPRNAVVPVAAKDNEDAGTSLEPSAPEVPSPAERIRPTGPPPVTRTHPSREQRPPRPPRLIQ